MTTLGNGCSFVSNLVSGRNQMHARTTTFVLATLGGGALGALWNAPVFSRLYKGFIALFMDPSAPLVGAGTAIVLAFIMGVPRICVP